jgi:hypothetical protein
VLLQLVGALQVGQQPLGGLRLAPHRRREVPKREHGLDSAAEIPGGRR